MISNATLTNLASPTATAAGQMSFGAGTTLSARCVMTGITHRRRIELGAEIDDANASMRVLKSQLGGARPDKGQRVTIAIDDDTVASRSFIVVHVVDHQKAGGLAHFECFLRGVA